MTIPYAHGATVVSLLLKPGPCGRRAGRGFSRHRIRYRRRELAPGDNAHCGMNHAAEEHCLLPGSARCHGLGRISYAHMLELSLRCWRMPLLRFAPSLFNRPPSIAQTDLHDCRDDLSTPSHYDRHFAFVRLLSRQNSRRGTPLAPSGSATNHGVWQHRSMFCFDIVIADGNDMRRAGQPNAALHLPLRDLPLPSLHAAPLPRGHFAGCASTACDMALPFFRGMFCQAGVAGGEAWWNYCLAWQLSTSRTRRCSLLRLTYGYDA